MDVRALRRGSGSAPDVDLPDPRAVPVDVQLLVEEARIGCTSGMLLCLDREQRLVYILGEIFGVTDVVGGELLETSRDNFRQKLSRARRDLHSFMQDQCGLVNRRTLPVREEDAGVHEGGLRGPGEPAVRQEHVIRVREVAAKVHDDMASLDEAYAEIHRDHPFHSPPDFVAAVQRPDRPAGVSIHPEENVMRPLTIVVLAMVSVSRARARPG